MIRKVIACDCFLNVCQTISVENTNRYILRQNVFFILELNLLCDWIEKTNKIEIRVCCFNCVNYVVCLVNHRGIQNPILINVTKLIYVTIMQYHLLTIT